MKEFKMVECIVCSTKFQPNTLTRIWNDSFCTDSCKEKYYKAKEFKMVEWTLDGKKIAGHSDFANDVVGFIYGIKYTDGTFYVGKKLIKSLVRLKPTKDQLAIRKNYVRKEMKNKPFLKYIGSSEKTKHLVVKEKRILELCRDKLNLTYCEQKWLMKLNVLCDERYHNDCIGGKFYAGKISSGK